MIISKFQCQCSSDFVDYIGIRLTVKLKNLYGETFPELVDHQMRKLVYEKNKQIMRRLGFTIDEINEQLNQGDVGEDAMFYFDPIGSGYLYGQSIKKTWEWTNAVINEDTETQERLIENEKIEEAKYKARFISYHNQDLCDPDEDRMKSTVSGRHLLAARRKHVIREMGMDNPKHFMDEKDTWFMR